MALVELAAEERASLARARRIRKLHSEIRHHVGQIHEKAADLGELLEVERSRFPARGSRYARAWTSWVEENCGFGIENARRYMKVAEARRQGRLDEWYLAERARNRAKRRTDQRNVMIAAAYWKSLTVLAQMQRRPLYDLLNEAIRFYLDMSKAEGGVPV